MRISDWGSDVCSSDLFVEGATHDNDVDNPRISHYIACYADAETSNQVISINGGVFIGPSLATEDLHLNPTGIFVTSSGLDGVRFRTRSEEHTSELQSLMRISYAVFCLTQKKNEEYRHDKSQRNLHDYTTSPLQHHK